MAHYKPNEYSDLSPYLVVTDSGKFIEFLEAVFDAKVLRKHERGDQVVHAEAKIGDSVIMFATANERFPASKSILHLYVKDVDSAFKRAIDNGSTAMGEPTAKEGEPDKRGNFMDPFGNFWSVSTQNA